MLSFLASAVGPAHSQEEGQRDLPPERGRPQAPMGGEEQVPPEQRDFEDQSFIGLALGRTEPGGGLGDAFGAGLDATVDYVIGLEPWLGVRLSLGILDYGKALDQQTAQEVFQSPAPNAEVKFQIFPISVGLVLHPGEAGGLRPLLFASVGLYNYQLLATTGTTELASRQSALGLMGGAELGYALAGRISIIAAGTYHYAFSGSSNTDPLFLITGEKTIQAFSIGLGIRLLLGDS